MPYMEMDHADETQKVEDLSAQPMAPNLQLLKKGQAARLSSRITSRRSVSFQDEVEAAQLQMLHGEANGEDSSEICRPFAYQLPHQLFHLAIR